MQVIKKNGIIAIIPKQNYGFRIECNIPIEEMKEHKEEFIKEILNKIKFDFDVELKECLQANSLPGLYQYIVRLV